MNTPKYTPGNWTIQRYTNYVGFSIWAENRGCIAERWYNPEQSDPYGSEIAANAALIAAAPDLLEACKALLAMHNDQIFINGEDDNEIVADALKTARKAIQRAGGAFRRNNPMKKLRL